MYLSRMTLAVWVAASLSATAAARAATPPAGGATPAKSPPPARSENAPLPASEKAASLHAPYAAGDCGFCHVRNDARSPGPISKPVNAICLECHQEFEQIMARKHAHPPAVDACTNCHNPHASAQRKLLHAELPTLCFGCHDSIRAVADGAKVKHGALTTGQKCVNCHNPHASDVEKLLAASPYDLCVGCHGVDGVKDWNGKPLTNMKRLLADNPVHHGPVDAKDCSACHQTHGGANFRLLAAEYPAQFYAPYDPKNYELCFGCHDPRIASDSDTLTLTNFRDGSRNLHYVHVHKADRGRTCRACHEVHAAKQDHQIRDGVPYGPRGWMLRLNYTKTPTGGTCTKTCHDTRSYVNQPNVAVKR